MQIRCKLSTGTLCKRAKKRINRIALIKIMEEARIFFRDFCWLVFRVVLKNLMFKGFDILKILKSSKMFVLFKVSNWKKKKTVYAFIFIIKYLNSFRIEFKFYNWMSLNIILISIIFSLQSQNWNNISQSVS